MNKAPEYLVEIDEVETRFKTQAQILSFLDGLESKHSVEFWLYVDRGIRPSWFRRILGLSERDIVPCFSVAKSGKFATLIFLDEDWSEYRAIDRDNPTAASEDTRRKLAMGDPVPVAEELCLHGTRAFQAMRHFIEHGSRPDWLTYEYIR